MCGTGLGPLSQTTYVFPVTIGYGNTVSKVLALYNASCKHNYISGWFVEYAKKNQLLDSPNSDEHRDVVTLVWRCAGLGRLGRYRQRTMFEVAPKADFDILFGPEENTNSSSSKADQFDKGIQEGHMTRKIPKISFESGIDSGFLVPVKQSSPDSTDSEGNPAPTLAEIKAQLDSNPRKDLAYARMSEQVTGGCIEAIALESEPSWNEVIYPETSKAPSSEAFLRYLH
jgi:hypothetical protein